MDSGTLITKTQEIDEFFEELNKSLPSAIDVYMIGGGALMFLGAKVETKDIDLIVSTREECDILSKTLFESGFESVRPTDGLEKVNLSDMVAKGDFRIDFFERQVCGVLCLSEAMKSRSKLILNLDKVRLFICCFEDIFLFKSVTEREGDLRDSENMLFIHDFDWDVLVREMRDQMAIGNAVWITYATERMVQLLGKDDPLVQPFIDMEREYLEKWAVYYEDSDNTE